MKVKRWQDKLTKKELKHLRWALNGATPSLKRFKELRTCQKISEQKWNNGITQCFDCLRIENKLFN